MKQRPLVEDPCQGDQSVLSLFQTGYFSSFPARSMRGFFCDLYPKNWSGLLEVKLRKCGSLPHSPNKSKSPGVSISQTSPHLASSNQSIVLYTFLLGSQHGSAPVSSDSLYLPVFPIWGPCYFSSLKGFRGVIDFWFINFYLVLKMEVMTPKLFKCWTRDQKSRRVFMPLTTFSFIQRGQT